MLNFDNCKVSKVSKNYLSAASNVRNVGCEV